MTYTTVSSKPNKYLVHWQCSPAEWQTFGKAYWKIKRCWLEPFVCIVLCSLMFILFFHNPLQTYEYLSNKNGTIYAILQIAAVLFFVPLLIVVSIDKIKSDHAFYTKLRIEPVNIYIDRDRVIIDNREYKLGRSIIDKRCRLIIGKSGRLSLLMFKVLRYRKGFRIETIFVPVPQKYESEAIELLQLLAPKSRSSFPKTIGRLHRRARSRK